MKSLNWKSIGLGIVIDWLTTFLLFTLCSLFLITPALIRDSTSAFEKMPSGINQNLAIFISFGATSLGGYVASGKQLTNLWRNCITFALISFLLAATLRSNVKSNMTISAVVIGVALNIPAALLGGSWRQRNLSRANQVLSTPQSPLPEVPRKL